MNTNFDARRAYRHVREIAFPRGVGSAGETAAREYIVRHFRDLGLHVVREPFHFTKFPAEVLPRLVCAIFTPIVFVVPWLGERFPIGMCILCLGSLAVAMGLTRWQPWLEKLYDIGKKYRSENVIATNDVPQTSEMPTLIFLAHYDSKSQVLPIAVRAVAYGIAIVGLISLTGFILVQLLFQFWPPSAVLWGIASVSGFCLLLLQFNFTQNCSPGGFDNASGVGVLLELARAGMSQKTRCIFLATGAEEYGMCGALRYIQQHAEEYNTHQVFVLNLDGLGIGNSVDVITRYGMPPTRTARKLAEALQASGEALGINIRERYFPVGVGFDSIPIASRGFETGTLTSGDVGKVALKVHSKHDRGELLNVESLQRVGELIVNFIELSSQQKTCHRGYSRGWGKPADGRK